MILNWKSHIAARWRLPLACSLVKRWIHLHNCNSNHVFSSNEIQTNCYALLAKSRLSQTRDQWTQKVTYRLVYRWPSACMQTTLWKEKKISSTTSTLTLVFLATRYKLLYLYTTLNQTVHWSYLVQLSIEIFQLWINCKHFLGRTAHD